RVRAERRQAAADNPLRTLEQHVSQQIESALDRYRELRDATIERVFLATYGAPLVQAMVGLGADDGPPRPRPAVDPDHAVKGAEKIASLRGAVEHGGVPAAAVRGLLYVGMPSASVDERGFAVIRKLRQDHEHRQLPLPAFKQLVRDQFFTLLL